MKEKLNFQENKVKIIAVGALLAAIIMLTTAYLKIPTAIGYFHLGDGFIFLAAAILGPYGAVAAAVGSALADLLAGYLVYAPVTFVIKGLMGLMVYKFTNQALPILIAAMTAAEVLMIAGYYGYEAILYGAEAALVSVPFNVIQGIVGVVFGVLLVKNLASKVNL